LAQIEKTRQKLDFKKIVKLTDPALCLQQFDTFLVVSSCNDRKWKSSEYAGTCMEKLMKSHQGNLFLVGFSYLEPLC
jgi:hypothetical protein